MSISKEELQKVHKHYRQYVQALREEEKAAAHLRKLFTEGKELLGIHKEYEMTRELGEFYLEFIGKLYDESV